MWNKWDYKKLNANEQKELIERIRYYYVEENKSDVEIANIISYSLSFEQYLRRSNNIHRDKNATNEIKKKNNLTKYGVDNPAKLDIIKEKQSKTLKDTYSKNKEDILNKRKQTNLVRYHTDHPMKDEDIKKKVNETKGYIGWNQNKVRATKLERYGNENYNNIEKIKETLKEKYDVDNVSQIEKIKEKKKETNLKRYGAEYTFQIKQFKEKAKQTCLNKYGVEYATQSKKVKDKIKESNLNKYGCEYCLSLPTVRQKIKETNLKKYGVEYISQKHLSKHTLNIISSKESFEKFILDNDVKYYYELEQLLPDLSQSYINFLTRKNGLDKYIDITVFTSKGETELSDFLTKHNINHIRNSKSIIYPLELDIYIPEYNVAIEYNGLYWHSSMIKEKNYHYNKSKLCEEKGIRLIHIWENEWNDKRQRPILENIILNACNTTENKIYARKCKIEVRKSKDMIDFFNKNNIQGFRGGSFAICLIYNNEVVMSYLIGRAFFGKGKYEYEVIRGATKLNYNVIGGASKIWNYFVKNYNPTSCVYYVDYNYFNGSSILHLDPNFKFIKTQPGFKNWWIKENVVKNREPARHKEIKELEKQGLVVPIFNSGTKVYVWEANL